MNVPLPPTDNLYKFLAIFGLVIVVMSFIFPHLLIFDLETQIIKLNGEAAVLEYDIQSYERNSKLKISATDEKQLRHRVAEVTGKKEIISGLAKQIKDLLGMLWIWIGLGIFLMIIGFQLWYFKVQKYQDRILKDDAEIRRSSRKRTTTSRIDSK